MMAEDTDVISEMLIQTSQPQSIRRSGPLALEDVSISGWRVPGALTVQALRILSLHISDSTWKGAVAFKDVRAEEVRIRDIKSARGIVFEDCDIEQFDIRSVSQRVSFVRCRIGRLVVHDVVGCVATQIAAEKVRLSGNIDIINIGDLDCQTLTLSDIAGEGTTIHLDRLEVAVELIVHDVVASAVDLTNSRVGKITIRDAALSRLSTRDLEASGTAQLSVQPREGKAMDIFLSGDFHQSLSIAALGPGGHASLAEIAVSNDLIVAGPLNVKLESGSVFGCLYRQFDMGPKMAMNAPVEYDHGHETASDSDVGYLVLSDGFRLGSVAVPDVSIRTLSQARQLSRDLLGRDSFHALNVLYRSLPDRPREQDQIYFAMRCAVIPKGIRGLSQSCQRWGLGFGVRLAEPLATLSAGILATAIIVWLLAPVASRTTEALWLSSSQSVLIASQLWFNVGIGLDESLAGSGWSAAAVVLTVMGLVFITTIIGIAIRRLVR